MSKVLHPLRTWRYGPGSVILLLLMMIWLGMAVRPCLAMASLGIAPSPEQHTRACWPQGVEVAQADAGDSEHCPAVVCDVLKASQTQLPKSSSVSLDSVKHQFFVAVFWILPAVLLLASSRPPAPLSILPPQLSPALKFRILLI